MRPEYRKAAESAASDWQDGAARKYRMAQLCLNDGWPRRAREYQNDAANYAATAWAILADLIGGGDANP